MRLSGSSGGLPEPPRAIRDVYRDLADRRLTLVPVALLALLVAVPLLLTNSPEAEPPPDPPDAEIAARAALETQPVVMRQPIGLRDYRRRLGGLTRSNPFQQRFRPPPGADASEGSGGEAGGQTEASTSAVTGGGSAQPSSPGAGASRGASTQRSPIRIEQRMFKFVADVSMRLDGGRLARRRGVDVLELLPTENTPLMVFLGTTLDLDIATFLVAPGSRGMVKGGQCLPSAEHCEYVRLRKGGAGRFRMPVVRGSEIAGWVIFELRLDGLRSVEAKDGQDGGGGSRQKRGDDPMRDAVEKQAGASAFGLWRGADRRARDEDAAKDD